LNAIIHSLFFFHFTHEGYIVSIKRNSTQNLPGFYLRLIPEDRDDERKIWDFKCDTLDELNEWSKVFNEAIELANLREGGGRSNDGSGVGSVDSDRSSASSRIQRAGFININ
jgi:hypothetical protein